MCSISKFSILLTEDCRGKATKDVIGGIVLDGYVNYKRNFILKLLYRFLNYDRYIPNRNLTKEIITNIEYEHRIDFLRIKNARRQINNSFKVMSKFINNLP